MCDGDVCRQTWCRWNKNGWDHERSERESHSRLQWSRLRGRRSHRIVGAAQPNRRQPPNRTGSTGNDAHPECSSARYSRSSRAQGRRLDNGEKFGGPSGLANGSADFERSREGWAGFASNALGSRPSMSSFNNLGSIIGRPTISACQPGSTLRTLDRLGRGLDVPSRLGVRRRCSRPARRWTRSCGNLQDKTRCQAHEETFANSKPLSSTRRRKKGPLFCGTG